MVIGAHTVFSCATNFLNGRKCVFCGSFKTVKTARSYVKCMLCGKQKSLSKLRREIAILQGFYQQQPAYRLASDLGLDAKTITRVYQRLRMVLFHTAELEGAKLSGEIEMDESYFGGARKGQRGRGARGKSIVFGLLERDGRVYTKVVESVSAGALMTHIENHTRKGSVYYTDAS
jgi:transposase